VLRAILSTGAAPAARGCSAHPSTPDATALVGLGPEDIVLDAVLLPQKGHGPQFSAIVVKWSPISATAAVAEMGDLGHNR